MPMMCEHMQPHRKCSECLTAERDYLRFRSDALKAALVLETEHCGEWATNAAMWAAERDEARARVDELEQECRDRQGTEDSLVAWNEEQATRIAALEAALREYADRDNWYQDEQGWRVFDSGSDDAHGWTIADAALAGGG